MASVSSFCHNCQLLFFDQSRIVLDDAQERCLPIPLQYEFEDDFPFLPILTSSADLGCRMCDFIKKVIWSHVKADPDLRELFQREERKLKDWPDETPKKLRLVLSEYRPNPTKMLRDPRKADPDSICGQIHLDGRDSAIKIESIKDDIAKPLPKYYPGVLPLTKQSLGMMQGWVSGCVDSDSDQHVACSKVRENIAPLRLLDVMDGEKVRIVKTEGLSLKYAILSYCWGRSAAVYAARTVESNISERMATFPLSSLPQTLKDSVTVARCLKIRYIWIDSLCIVQESDEWSREAGRMMDYYANAYLTIVPIICSSADQGFLGSRPRCVNLRLTGTWVGQPEKLVHFSYPTRKYGHLEVEQSTWGTRGWTLQERLLSERIVYFGRSGLRFECRSAICEEFNQKESIQDIPTTFLASSSHLSSEWDTPERARSLWYQIVSNYVERQLTRESDKLTALSGIARKFEILFGGNDEYISGVWKDDLCHGLCWKSWTGAAVLEHTRSLNQSSSFPSWSWCSTRRSILWTDGTGSIQCAELLGKIKSSDDKTCGGKSEYAKLLLRAWIFPARLLGFDFPSDMEIEICLDAEEEDTKIWNATNDYLAVVMSTYLDDDRDEEEWRASPTEAPHEVYGLIVEDVGSRYEGIEEYRRIGTFDVTCGIDMGIELSGDSKSVAKLFYEQAYMSRRTIALI